jgi:hypothetical protein
MTCSPFREAAAPGVGMDSVRRRPHPCYRFCPRESCASRVESVGAGHKRAGETRSKTLESREIRSAHAAAGSFVPPGLRPTRHPASRNPSAGTGALEGSALAAVHALGSGFSSAVFSPCALLAAQGSPGLRDDLRHALSARIADHHHDRASRHRARSPHATRGVACACPRGFRSPEGDLDELRSRSGRVSSLSSPSGHIRSALFLEIL